MLKDEQKYAAESYRKDEELLDDPPHGFEVDSPAGKRTLYLLKEQGEEQIIVEVDMDEQADAQDDSAGALARAAGPWSGWPARRATCASHDGTRPVPSPTHCAEQSEGGEEEDDQEELPPVSFRVQVVKDAGLLTFQCLSNGQYVTITDLALQSEEDGGAGPQQQQRGRRTRAADDEEEEEEEEGEDSEEGSDQYVGPPFEELDDTLQQAFLDYLEERGVTAELGRYLQKLLADKAATEYQAWLQRMRDFIAH